MPVVNETETRAEVERRLGRPWPEVEDQLTDLFEMEWEEVSIVIETSADKGDRSRADVIVELVERTEHKPAVHARVRRSMIRWIGKPWRERENPWDRFKHRLPDAPPPTDTEADDLDEWTPYRPEEHE